MTTAQEQVQAAGDDPNYVEHMAEFIAANDVAYHSYYNVGDANILALGDPKNVQSTAAYVAAFS